MCEHQKRVWRLVTEELRKRNLVVTEETQFTIATLALEFEASERFFRTLDVSVELAVDLWEASWRKTG
jgi:hypothetical protein